MRAGVLVVVASCGYRPGSFHSSLQPFTGERATIGCVDVSIDRRRDLPNGDVVVSFAFGNRCDHPTLVDLAAAVVRGRVDHPIASGDTRLASSAIAEERGWTELVAVDPRNEIVALRLDGRAVGTETIAYEGDDVATHEVCVDAASIVHAEPAMWSCFPGAERQP
jgi:hypothetical protein